MLDREATAALLREIDHIEADMRRLESRLTSVRSKLWASIGGEQSRFVMDGRTRQEVAAAEAYAASVEF